MLYYSEYEHDIDFKYFNKLSAKNMYNQLMLNIYNDGRLMDRKLCGDSITLQEFMYTLYVGIAKRSDVKFILHKVANKISLLEKYITLHFNADEEDDVDKFYLYENKIYSLEKELLDMIDEEKQYEKRYNYLKEKYGVVK
tara:strand:- start:101 stop:520 length:420 start_codon:yes stop_codon:yes gene_type:complete